MRKILISILTAMAITVSSLPVIAANNTEDVELFAESGKLGDNITYTIKNGVATISGKGATYDFVYDYENEQDNPSPFEDKTGVKKVIIENGVTHIGKWAFSGCVDLEEVVFEDSVEEIGYASFWGCEKLQKITFSKKLKKIVLDAFSGCRSLNELHLPSFEVWLNLDRKTDDGSQILGSYQTDNKIYINGKLATDITIPYGTETIPNCLLFGWSCVETVTIPKTVKSIEYAAFYGCKNLTDVTIPDSVESIGGSAFEDTAYYDNSANWDNGVLFKDNHLIGVKTEEVSGDYEIPAGTKSIIARAFEYCEGLTGVTIPEGVKVIDYSTFANCTNLKYVEMPNSLREIWDSAFCNTAIEHLEIPDGVEYIGYDSFRSCESLKSVVFPDALKSIDSCAFMYCTMLDDFTLPEGLTYVGPSVFYNTAFYDNTDNWVNNVLIKDTVFLEANTEISGVYNIPENIKTIASWGFRNCGNLTGVTIPEGVTKIVFRTFDGCTSLENVVFPDSLDEIDSYAFAYCRTLESMKIPDSVEVIGESAFSYCTGLKEITIPNGVKVIEGYTFYECPALTDVYYNGTESQWKRVEIDPYENDSFINANVHFAALPDVTNASVTKSEDGYRVSVSLDNAEYKTTMLVVVYDGGVFKGFETVKVNAGDTEKTVDVSADSADEAKVFIWSSLLGLEPLCEVQGLEITE